MQYSSVMNGFPHPILILMIRILSPSSSKDKKVILSDRSPLAGFGLGVVVVAGVFFVVVGMGF